MRDLDGKIKQIKREMNTQDKRFTAWPLFIVQVKVKECTLDGAHDDYVYYNIEGDEVDKRSVCKECKEAEVGYPACGWCDCNTKVAYRNEWKWAERAGFFFTAKACKTHIKFNKHHYGRGARSYAISACYNNELQVVMEHLAGNKLT